MFDEILTKIFGSRNDRLIKQYRRQCEAINKLEPAMQALTDEQLQAKTEEFRQRVTAGESTDALLPEAFAVVREGSRDGDASLRCAAHWCYGLERWQDC